MKEKKTVAQGQGTPTPPPKATQPATLHRVVTRLTREQIDWMDNLSKDAYFTTGHTLHRMQILAALVEVARRLGITGRDLKGPEDLVEYFEEQLASSREKWKANSKLGRIIKELKSHEKP